MSSVEHSAAESSSGGISVSLELPTDGFIEVAHLLVAGAASRLSFSIEAIDDLQLAFESVLRAAAPAGDGIRIGLEGDRELKLSVGPFTDRILEELQADDRDTLSLRRQLGQLVDAFEATVDHSGVTVVLRTVPSE